MKKSKININALKPLTKKYHLPAAKTAQKMVMTAIKADGIATLMIGVGAASCATLVSIGNTNKKYKETQSSIENLANATASQISEISKAHNKLAKTVKNMGEDTNSALKKYDKRIKSLELQIKNHPVQNMDPAAIAQRFKQNEVVLEKMVNRVSSLEDDMEKLDAEVKYNKKALDMYADATAGRFEKIEANIQDMKDNPVVISDGESIVLHDPKMDTFMEEQKKQMKVFTDAVKKIVNETIAKTDAMEEKLEVVDELMNSVDSMKKDAIMEAKKEAAANYNGVKKLISEVDNRVRELEDNDVDSITGIGPFKEAVSALKADHVSKEEFTKFREIFDKILKLDIPSLSQFINRKTKEYDETLNEITSQISKIPTGNSSINDTELESLKLEMEKLKNTNPTTEIVEKVSTIVTNVINNPNQPIVKSLNGCIQTLELHKNAIIEIQEIIEKIDEAALTGEGGNKESTIIDKDGNKIGLRDLSSAIENLNSGFDLFYDALVKTIENDMNLLGAVEGGDKDQMLSVYEAYKGIHGKLVDEDEDEIEEDDVDYENLWKDGADEEDDDEEEENDKSSTLEDKPVNANSHVIYGNGPLFPEIEEEAEKLVEDDSESEMATGIVTDAVETKIVYEEPGEDLHDPRNVDDFDMIHDYKHMPPNAFLEKYGEVNYERAKEMMRLAMEDDEDYGDEEDDEEDDEQKAINDGNDLLRQLNDLDDEIEEEDDSIFTDNTLTEEEIQEYIDAGIVDPFTYEVNEYKLRKYTEEKVKKEAEEKKDDSETELTELEKDAPENKNCGFDDEDDDDKYKYYTDEEREEYRQKAENFDPEKETSIFDGIVSDEYREAFMEERKKYYEEIAETGKSEKINIGAMKEMMKEGTAKIIESQIPRETHLKDAKDLEKLNEYYQTLVHLSMSVHYLARETLHKQDDWVPDYFKKEVTDFMINACDVDPNASWKKVTVAVRQAWIAAKNELGFNPEDMERDPNNDLIDEVYEHYNLGASTNQPGAGAAPSGMNRAQRRAAAKANKKKGKRR